VSTPVPDAPFAVAVKVTFVSEATIVVVTANVADVAPGRTFTVAAAAFATMALLLVKVTTRPAAGAGVARLIVPVVATLPATTAGEKVIEAGCDNRTLTEAVTDVPLADAETVTFALEVTAVDVAWKVALVCPAATVTVAGTAKDPAEELSPTT
jgi:ribosomal protein L18E